MKIKIPDTFMGRPIKGAMEKLLAGSPGTPPQGDPLPPSNPPSDLSEPEKYLQLPEGKYGNYDYPNLFISLHRLPYTPQVEQIGQNHGWALAHSAKEYEGTGPEFVGNMNFEEAIMLNKEAGNATLSPVLYREFLKLVKEGIDGKVVYDGTGNHLQKDRLIQVFNEITEVRAPYRAEWIDAKFSKQGRKMRMTYPIFKNNAWEYATEELEGHLKRNKTPGISLESWLKKASPHGLPLTKFTKGELYYWAPVDGDVAGFWADSGWADFGCYGGPSYRNGGLGVRAVSPKI